MNLQPRFVAVLWFEYTPSHTTAWNFNLEILYHDQSIFCKKSVSEMTSECVICLWTDSYNLLILLIGANTIVAFNKIDWQSVFCLVMALRQVMLDFFLQICNAMIPYQRTSIICLQFYFLFFQYCIWIVCKTYCYECGKTHSPHWRNPVIIK